MPKLSKLDSRKTYAGILLISFALWLLCVLIFGRESQFMYLFIQAGHDKFDDFYYSVGSAVQHNPYTSVIAENQDHAYPPLAYLIYNMFRGFIDTNIVYSLFNFSDLKSINSLSICLWVLYGIFVITMFLLLIKSLKCSKINAVLVAIAIVVSKPILYALERGNIIILCLLLNIVFIFFHKSENKIIRELSLIALAISAGIKLTPALLGLLLVFEKEWKLAVRTVIYGILAFFLPFLCFEGGFTNIVNFFHNTTEHFKAYKVTDSTLFGCFQNILFLEENDLLITTFKIVAIILALVILAGIPFYKTNWQKILGLSMLMIFAPSVSQFYCLMYIIPAIIAFLNENETICNDKSLIAVFALFCMINLHEPFILCSAIGELGLIAYLVCLSSKRLLDRI